MKISLSLFILLITTLPSLLFAWEPEHEIPKPTFVGEVSDAEREVAKELRRKMVNQLEYWRIHGLPDPPDMKSLIYIPTYSGLGYRDLLEKMNPSIPNILAHAHEQYMALKNSKLLQVMKVVSSRKEFQTILAQMGISGEDLPIEDRIFALYAKVRYGLASKHFFEDIVNNTELIHCPSLQKELMKDNAYYRNVPKIDLTDLLQVREVEQLTVKGKVSDYAILMAEINKSINMDAMKKLSHEVEPSIVILPRTTQTSGDLAVSTLADFSVTKHELGHHMVKTLSGTEGKIDLMINEAMADYFAAVSSGDPKIGAFFATASTEIARRLNNNYSSEAAFLMAMRLQEIGEKKLLRDLSDFSTIDDLKRYYLQTEDHDSANSVRNFLWRLRHENPNVDGDQFDRLVIQSVSDYSDLPVVMSKRSSGLVQFRSMLVKFKKEMKFKAAEKKLKTLKKKQFIEMGGNTLSDEEIILVEMHTKRMLYAGSLGTMTREEYNFLWSISDPEILDSYLKSKGFDLSKISQEQIEQLSEELSDALLAEKLEKFTSLTPSERSFINDATQVILNVKENIEIDWNHRLGGLFRKRPAIKADYVIPEYYRTFYRNASKIDEKLASYIRKEANRSMNASSIVVMTKSGNKELVFVKSGLDQANLMARAKVNDIVNNLEVSRTTIDTLKRDLIKMDTLLETTPNAQALIENQEVIQKKIVELVSLYGRHLEALQEFERTGSTFRLFIPHPLLSGVELVGKTFKFVVGQISKKKKLAALKNLDCKGLLLAVLQ